MPKSKAIIKNKNTKLSSLQCTVPPPSPPLRSPSTVSMSTTRQQDAALQFYNVFFEYVSITGESTVFSQLYCDIGIVMYLVTCPDTMSTMVNMRIASLDAGCLISGTIEHSTQKQLEHNKPSGQHMSVQGQIATMRPVASPHYCPYQQLVQLGCPTIYLGGVSSSPQYERASSFKAECDISVSKLFHFFMVSVSVLKN